MLFCWRHYIQKYKNLYYILDIIEKDKYSLLQYESVKYIIYTYNFNQNFIKNIIRDLYALTQ